MKGRSLWVVGEPYLDACSVCAVNLDPGGIPAGRRKSSGAIPAHERTLSEGHVHVQRELTVRYPYVEGAIGCCNAPSVDVISLPGPQSYSTHRLAVGSEDYASDISGFDGTSSAGLVTGRFYRRVAEYLMNKASQGRVVGLQLRTCVDFVVNSARRVVQVKPGLNPLCPILFRILSRIGFVP